MTAGQRHNPSNILAPLRIKAEDVAQRSRPTYRQAVTALALHLGAHPRAIPDFPTPDTLADWVVSMTHRGLSLRTARLYFDAISGLWSAAVRDSLLPDRAEAFSAIRPRLRELAAADRGSIAPDTLDRVLRLTRAAAARSLPTLADRLAADIILTALLTATPSLADTVRIRTVDIIARTAATPDDSVAAELAAIAARHADPRRRYLFDLRQSERTPRQLAAAVDTLVGSLLARYGLDLPGSSPSDTIAAWWLLAALRCGTTPTAAVRALGTTPQALPALSLCATGGSPEPDATLTEAVALSFIDDPLRWYAMRLRPHTDYDRLIDRLNIIGGEVPIPELFYPSEEIARRTGRRLTREQRPVIRDIVFFRSRLADILPLFSRIGDLAWCYTVSGRPGSPYAPIPERSFALFQATIGAFTPDYDVAPAGTFTPLPGQRVVIIGGLFDGSEAIIESIQPAPAGSDTLYRFTLTGDNGIEWRISVDSRQTRPA